MPQNLDPGLSFDSRLNLGLNSSSLTLCADEPSLTRQKLELAKRLGYDCVVVHNEIIQAVSSDTVWVFLHTPSGLSLKISERCSSKQDLNLKVACANLYEAKGSSKNQSLVGWVTSSTWFSGRKSRNSLELMIYTINTVIILLASLTCHKLMGAACQSTVFKKCWWQKSDRHNYAWK